MSARYVNHGTSSFYMSARIVLAMSARIFYHVFTCRRFFEKSAGWYPLAKERSQTLEMHGRVSCQLLYRPQQQKLKPTLQTLTLRLETAQKPYIVWPSAPKALN